MIRALKTAFALALLLCAQAHATVTALQVTGATGDSVSSTLKAFTSNVASGSLISITAAKDNGTAFTAGNATKSAGSCAVGTIALDKTFTFDLGASNFVTVGVWSTVTTGAGPCTFTVAAAAGTYMEIGIGEFSSSLGWDATAANRLDGTPTTGSDATDNVFSWLTSSMTSSAPGLFVGAAASNGSGNILVAPEMAWTQIFAQTDASLHLPGTFIYRTVSGTGITDAAEWVVSASNNQGFAAAQVAYKETGGGGGGTAVPVFVHHLIQQTNQ